MNLIYHPRLMEYLRWNVRSGYLEKTILGMVERSLAVLNNYAGWFGTTIPRISVGDPVDELIRKIVPFLNPDITGEDSDLLGNFPPQWKHYLNSVIYDRLPSDRAPWEDASPVNVEVWVLHG